MNTGCVHLFVDILGPPGIGETLPNLGRNFNKLCMS
jgi:hypothetical protein